MDTIGDCIVERVSDHFYISRADPRIWISPQFLADELHPDVTLDGDVLTLNAVNRRVVYRINRDVVDSWGNVLAEWPD